MNEKYINAADCEKFFYEHLDDNGIIAALNAIEEMPAADVKPVKHGYWIDTPLDRYKKFESKCSGCGWHGISNYDSYVDIYEFEYCPHCGAKMDGDTNDET